MDKRTDGQTDKRVDRRTDERTDGQTDGRTDRRTINVTCVCKYPAKNFPYTFCKVDKASDMTKYLFYRFLKQGEATLVEGFCKHDEGTCLMRLEIEIGRYDSWNNIFLSAPTDPNITKALVL